MSGLRSRWAAIGAAIAVSLGAGGVALVSAAGSGGDGLVFVPVMACRLVDTRVGIGVPQAAVGEAQTIWFDVRGTVGECVDLPIDTEAVSLNLSAVNGSKRSYLTLFPDGTLGSVPSGVK